MSNSNSLTDGRRLARNVVWNLLGTGAPLIVAVVTIPFLIDGMGTARFGVLTLTWVVVGYFSLFDLGLGRALTKLVAERLGAQGHTDTSQLIATAMSFMTALGLIAGLLIAACSRLLVFDVLNIPAALQAESLAAFYLLAVSTPIVITSTGLRGVLEAHQKFGIVNAVRTPLGIVTFAGPMAVLPFSNSLVPIVAVLVTARIVAWLAYFVTCIRSVPEFPRKIGVHREHVSPLLRFGGWMTISNVIGPMMVYLDRVFIGAMMSMTAVAYYTTPYEVVVKLRVLPVALMGVLFPAFATSIVQDRERASALFSRAVIYIFASLFPVVFTIVTFAPEAMGLWLGSEFARNSSLVLQLLAAGVFINCHANVPFGLIQSAGRPDLTAKLHLVELPCYIALLVWLLSSYGIVGAAIAWVLRMTVDTTAMYLIAHHVLPEAAPTRSLAAAFGSALLLLVIGALLPSGLVKFGVWAITVVVFCIVAWSFLLNTEEKGFLLRRIRNRKSSHDFPESYG